MGYAMTKNSFVAKVTFKDTHRERNFSDTKLFKVYVQKPVFLGGTDDLNWFWRKFPGFLKRMFVCGGSVKCQYIGAQRVGEGGGEGVLPCPQGRMKLFYGGRAEWNCRPPWLADDEKLKKSTE